MILRSMVAAHWWKSRRSCSSYTNPARRQSTSRPTWRIWTIIREFYRRFASVSGRLDVLVNNAGVAPEVRADLLEASPENFDRVMSINLRGPYFLTQAVARWMVEQRQADANFRGCIVNVSSVSATIASVNRGDYCISKAGIAMATMLWASRLAEFGIDVYEVRPGVIATDMTAGATEKYDKLIAEGLTIEKRWGTAEDVGRAVAASPAATFPTQPDKYSTSTAE